MRIKTKEDRRDRIKLRIRKRVRGTTERPRLTVFRSVTHIYVQVVNDADGTTIASASSLEPAVKGTLDKAAKGGNVGRRQGDRQDHRRAAAREGREARGVRPERVPLSRPHQSGG